MAWIQIVVVPSLKSAQAEARRWRPRADKVKVVREGSGWYGVYAEGISEGARIIFGLNPRGGKTMARKRHLVKAYTRRGKGGKRIRVKSHYSK